jgi:hypothetical protein
MYSGLFYAVIKSLTLSTEEILEMFLSIFYNKVKGTKLRFRYYLPAGFSNLNSP